MQGNMCWLCILLTSTSFPLYLVTCMSVAGLFLRSSVSTVNKSPSQYLSAFNIYPMDRAGTTLAFQMVYRIFLRAVFCKSSANES